MSQKPLSTDPYKGVRDFYPEDAAVQKYIFDTWSKTAESFGYQRYDASVLEPAELYKTKGAENEELVNEQTYTFTDRGDREVTLRPEMTPTVARMIAKKQRELGFPVRWYSIPNLFRYERTQKGRLREHWQLNCDLFGSHDLSADVEMIALAYQTLIDFGASPDSFSIRINDRQKMNELYSSLDLDIDTITAVTRLNDRKNKLEAADYESQLSEIVGEETKGKLIASLEDEADELPVIDALRQIGITNVTYDKYLARGFDYYTGTIFEVFDVSGENNRSLLGGGRYDDLTSMFGGERVTGVGFGMGDVTMRDFLETHDLLPKDLNQAIELIIIPNDPQFNILAQKIASQLRYEYSSVLVDISTKKLAKKLADANAKGVKFVTIIGEDETKSGQLTIKDLTTEEEKSFSF